MYFTIVFIVISCHNYFSWFLISLGAWYDAWAIDSPCRSGREYPARQTKWRPRTRTRPQGRARSMWGQPPGAADIPRRTCPRGRSSELPSRTGWRDRHGGCARCVAPSGGIWGLGNRGERRFTGAFKLLNLNSNTGRDAPWCVVAKSGYKKNLTHSAEEYLFVSWPRGRLLWAWMPIWSIYQQHNVPYLLRWKFHAPRSLNFAQK